LIDILLIRNVKKNKQGIRTMVIGFRDNNGMVHKISPLNISDIERTTVSIHYVIRMDSI